MTDPSPYSPTTIETVFKLLDNKLVTFGIPGALGFIGIQKASQSLWTEAALCFAGAAGVWIVIKVGKKIAPKLDQLMDWALATAERSLLEGWSALRSDFEGQYLKQQARLCEEFTSEGFNPDRTAIPLLEEVFVPLELQGNVGNDILVQMGSPRKKRSQTNAILLAEHLSIWDLLARSQRDRKFRQMSILAKGGMGKTTLLRHIALIYGQRKQRRYRAPQLVPVLLRLRDWSDLLTQPTPPSLPVLITDFHIPSLSRNQPLAPPPKWADTLLASNKALVMFDGFDEVPEANRQQVSQWLSAQMREYPNAVFIVTSRPAGFKDYAAQRPAVPIFVNKFTPTQQEQFIRRWYLCQEKCCRSEKQIRQAKRVAQERADQLITQLQQRQTELGHMAENPLLLNMLVTFHRFDPSRDLPRQRIDLYRGICKLQLDDRPRARLIRMVVSFEHSQSILQMLALAMVKQNQIKVQQQALLKFLNPLPIWQREEVDPASWLKQIVEVGELLVEREPGEYEFPHLSFQGFFAATRLAQAHDEQARQNNAQLVLQNWNGAIWRETVLLYTAQLNPKLLDQVIRQACKLGSEAAVLADICLNEYPQPEKLNAELGFLLLLQNLSITVQDSKYQTLETLLKDQQFREADQETYRLMITTVGKEEGQWFDNEDLLNFPCEDLRILDQLWVNYSKGRFGFSVQKKIWQDCGSPTSPGKDWERFCVRVGWQNKDATAYVSYSDFKFDLKDSPTGELPLGLAGAVGSGRVRSLFSRTATCEL